MNSSPVILALKEEYLLSIMRTLMFSVKWPNQLPSLLDKVKKNIEKLEEETTPSLMSTQFQDGSSGTAPTMPIGTLFSDWPSTINQITKIMAEWETESYQFLLTRVTSIIYQHTPMPTWTVVETQTSFRISITKHLFKRGILFTLVTVNSKEKPTLA